MLDNYYWNTDNFLLSFVTIVINMYDPSSLNKLTFTSWHLIGRLPFWGLLYQRCMSIFLDFGQVKAWLEILILDQWTIKKVRMTCIYGPHIRLDLRLGKWDRRATLFRHLRAQKSLRYWVTLVPIQSVRTGTITNMNSQMMSMSVVHTLINCF